MLNSKPRALSGAIASLALLAGCATTNPNVDSRLSSNTKFFQNSTADACAKGAAAGALGVLAVDQVRIWTGNDDAKEMTTKDRMERSAVGAVAGCALGAGADYYLKNKQEQHADEQERLQVIQAEVQAENQRLTNLVDVSKVVIAEDKAEIDRLAELVRQNELTIAEARAQLVTVDANKEELRSTIAALEERKQNWTDVAALEKEQGSDTRALDAEITSMETKVAALQSELNELDEYQTVNGLA